MGSSVNRSLQAKYRKSRVQCAAFSVDAGQRVALHEASVRVKGVDTSPIALRQRNALERKRLLAHII